MLMRESAEQRPRLTQTGDEVSGYMWRSVGKARVPGAATYLRWVGRGR